MKYLITALCSLLLCTQALGNNAVLLGPDLEPVSVRLEAIAPDAIKVIDRRGETQTLKPEQVLRLTLADSRFTTRKSGQVKVTLRDGQVIVGDWAGGGRSNESISVTFGDTDQVVDLPLDVVTSVVLRPGAIVAATEDDDVLLLATGETLAGFVESMGAEALDFVLGDADDAIKIPLERVDALAIANKPKPAAAKPGTLRVTLNDGTVLLVDDATLARDDDGGSDLVGQSALSIEPKIGANPGASVDSPSPVRFSIDDVVTIEPVSTKVSLSSLSDAVWEMTAGGEAFGVPMPPRVSPEGAIHLHAPVTVGFDLPDGASRLAFTVAMDLDDATPSSNRKMAGCELIVFDGDEIIARHTLTPDGPPKRLNLPLAGGDLRLALEGGVNGPVLDRVVITQAELLVSD